MPRTKKAPSTAKKADVSTAVDLKADKQAHNAKVRQYLKDLDVYQSRMINDLKRQCEDIDAAITQIFQEKKLKLLPVFRNKTFGELETLKLSSSQFFSLSEASSINSLLITSTVRKGHQKKRSLSLAEDEAESNNEGGKRKSRSTAKKNATTVVNAQKTTRRTRSLSKSKMKTTESNLLKKGFVTPANKQPPSETFGMVTPKMKPNTPQVILRMPKEGEMAISMQGSPLLVNPVVSSVPNVSIPLDDGRTISIQPNPLSRLSQLPEMDTATLSRLQVLRDNLIKMCEYTK